MGVERLGLLKAFIMSARRQSVDDRTSGIIAIRVTALLSCSKYVCRAAYIDKRKGETLQSHTYTFAMRNCQTRDVYAHELLIIAA